MELFAKFQRRRGNRERVPDGGDARRDDFMLHLVVARARFLVERAKKRLQALAKSDRGVPKIDERGALFIRRLHLDVHLRIAVHPSKRFAFGSFEHRHAGGE